jgi:hypothetical protein
MKRFLPFLTLAIVAAACNTNPQQVEKDSAASAMLNTVPAFNPDTVGLAAYQQWKSQNELANAAQFQTAALAAAPQKQAAAPYVVPKKAVAKKKTSTPRASSPAPAPESTVYNGNEGTSVSNEGANEAKAEEKQGWSKAAKGAAIGTTAGAAAGAIISKKNRVLGGVIGGVVGGAVGYGVGRKMDKNDGRY